MPDIVADPTSVVDMLDQVGDARARPYTGERPYHQMWAQIFDRLAEAFERREDQ